MCIRARVTKKDVWRSCLWTVRESTAPLKPWEATDVFSARTMTRSHPVFEKMTPQQYGNDRLMRQRGTYKQVCEEDPRSQAGREETGHVETCATPPFQSVTLPPSLGNRSSAFLDLPVLEHQPNRIPQSTVFWVGLLLLSIMFLRFFTLLCVPAIAFHCPGVFLTLAFFFLFFFLIYFFFRFIFFKFYFILFFIFFILFYF